MTTTSTLCNADLRQFTGTEYWCRHGLNRKVLFTNGAKYVADHGGAYWLLDEIALAQVSLPCVKAAAFQLWRLRVHLDRSASLTCENGDGHIVYSQSLAFTDFPLDTITFYFCNDVIHLPSEY